MKPGDETLPQRLVQERSFFDLLYAPQMTKETKALHCYIIHPLSLLRTKYSLRLLMNNFYCSAKQNLLFSPFFYAVSAFSRRYQELVLLAQHHPYYIHKF
jgi:hypothetical protein